MVLPLPEVLPVPATGPIDTSDISMAHTNSSDLDPIWRLALPYLRTRANDLHLPMAVAFAERLCVAHPEADSLLVRVTVLLHDTGWARVDAERIITDGFQNPHWRQADIRYEHERHGCDIAREILGELGYDQAFIDQVVAIIDGHDTRKEAHSLEDALVRDADRSWRFAGAGFALSCDWFNQTPDFYVDRLEREIIPEMLTEAGLAMARADLERSRSLLRTDLLR